MSMSDAFAIAASTWNSAMPLLQRYLAVRKTTETITEGLSTEDQMVQSMPEASPTKWHLAHTTWFFETFILKPFVPGYRPFNNDFTFLFNSYYKQVGKHPNRAFRGLFSRPGLDEIRDYRHYVNEQMLKLLADREEDEAAVLTELGLNHEQQHQELIITDIKHALWSNPLRPAWRPRFNSASTESGVLSWIECKEGLYVIGFGGNGFSFDNETPRHQVFLNHFQIASRPVTNAAYLEFIRDGGYSRPELWLSDGWDTVNALAWTAPLYWEESNNQWMTYTCSGLLPLNPDEPVCHISYYEADAYARWAGARLPTETEWEIAATGQEVEGNFLESGRFHPAPAAHSQFFGDVWEWTSSPYTAYPGFRPAQGALGEYNGKFMCNQMVLRGGSCATPQSHIRETYRNFFPPQSRWQFMGFRLAK
jgi:ergothioneine biosynthesis protein EgtB